MATKAQLTAELELLKQQLASRDEATNSEQADAKPDDPGEDETNGPKEYVGKMLESHGIDKDQIDVLWTQFTEELSDLTRERPLLTVAAAIGIGVVLGRMSK